MDHAAQQTSCDKRKKIKQGRQQVELKTYKESMTASPKSKDVLKVGLTGGIGSGKTTVAHLFELLQVPVYFADDASKSLYHSDLRLMEQIKTLFGENIYSPDGLLNRSMLASIVFNDPLKLDMLNELVHPLTIQDAQRWMEKQTAPYVIKEAALLFESGSAKGLDLIIGISAPLPLRIQRVMERDGLNEQEVLSRANRQMNENIKMRLCDFIIYNNEMELVIPQVETIHKRLLVWPGTTTLFNFEA